MRNILRKRIEEKLPDYYPEDKFRVEGISRVGTKPGSTVYRIRICGRSQGYRDLYAKEYRKDLASNIHEIMGLTPFHNLFLMPKILGYHDGLLISEGINGGTLTRVILKSILSRARQPLLECSRKIGMAIGALQNLTPRGTQRVGDLDLYLTREIETEDYFKTILSKDLLKEIRAQAEELKDLKTRVAQYHGDPSPHNILMSKGRVHLIDHSFQVKPTFIDPTLYIVSLELVKNRLGLPMSNILSLMENKFIETYAEMTKETYDQPIWTTIKTLTYLHFLLMYATRERTIKKALVGSVDRVYLLKRIREVLK